MDMNRREFLQLLALASAGGFLLENGVSHAAVASVAPKKLN